MLGAAVLVFGLFILAFFVKQKPKDEPVQIHTCVRCSCDRNKRVLESDIVYVEESGGDKEEALDCGKALNREDNLSA